ncbi:CheR family methyltransferase [Massilia niastensis]|uniref:CheR family methyltransferase n=1 Tax=Massilia niastensis TaxID=544911 RepID=UPI0003A81F45|nr:CheR family methyltransferase [Massilia niastensis]
MHDCANEPSTPPTERRIVPSHIDFPVVGIGASAGGLPALLRFFENMPQRTGMAFVVILHLSPKHQSSADKVLQRATGMPVIQVVAPVLLEPDHVYVIAPSKQLSMVDGYLSLSELQRPRGGHIAIDIFFRTLAEVHRERAIAIVLSGTGSDGAVGLTRVKEQGGLTLVQSPEDAEHDGMPQAAIRTGMVDFVLPVADLPQKLVDLWDNARIIELPPTGEGEDPGAHLPDPSAVDLAEDALQRIIALLLSRTGRDFRQYKRATVLRRIERRLQVRGVHTLPDYCALLESDPREHAALLDDMLIGVTNFFRDRDSFEAVEREIVPELFKDRGPTEEVRVWVAACSTGEEAYSMAMLLADHAAEMAQPPSFQVFASDIDEQAIVQARNGVYPASIITDVAPVRLRQHFAKDGDRYRIRKAIRDRILFAAHDLLRDPPFSRLDLVSCRNLLIYLNRDAQSRVLEMFHFALKPGGYLFLGSSESAESVSDFFIPVDKKNRIYRARPTARAVRYSGGQVSGNIARIPDAVARQPARRQFSYAEVHQRALAQVAPPSVVLDRESNIVHMSQPAGQFLRMGGGEPSRNVLALVLPELRLELRSALYQAHQNGVTVECRPIPLQLPTGSLTIGMRVQPYRDEESAGEFILVLFTEVAPDTVAPPGGEVRGADVVLAQLEAELQRVKEQLRETIEYSEVSTEELRASNEELQAINEELRSATEELETSKEELQSVNEELITVNYELKVKVEETGKANDDLNNLIASTDIATVFVDSALRIKRFTPRAADIFSIIPSDLGRSLLDLTHRLDYDELADDVSATFESLRPVEREVRSNDGRCYIVRLLPYRTIEDRIEGAVMTFFDISARRQAEEQVRAGEARMRLVAESTHDYAIVTTDAGGRVTSWNKGAERIFGHTEQEMLGCLLDRLYVPEDLERGAPEDEMRRAREEGRAEDERWHMRKDGSRFFSSGVTTPLGPNAAYGYAKIARDQTDRLRQMSERDEAISHEQRERYSAENAMAMKDEFLAIMSHELRQPLNMININAELLSRVPQVRESGTALRCTKAIRQSVMSQATIIEDLLDMSRVRTGKLALSMAPVDIGKVVGAIIEVAHADPVSRGLEIALSVVDEGMCVMADAVRLEQVVMNLLSNAIKFTPAGGRIEVRLACENGKARIDVADTGQGIAPGSLPKIFDMFGQPNSVTTRSKGGLGIGLALVRELVGLHGGRIEAFSEGIGKGSLFSVWLPLLEQQHPAADGAEGEATGPHINGLRILVVDDVEDAVEVMKALLDMHGAHVLTATSALDALRLLEHEQVDLLVSDISMPAMDGYALLREVHAMPRHAHLPAVAVTGLGREQDIAQAREAGFAAHLGKPMSIDRLMAIIPELLRRRAH